MDTIATALKTGFGEVGTALTGIIGDAVPIVVPILGGVLVVVVGFNVYKKLTGKI